MNIVIKVCGMRDPGNIAEVAKLGPDYLGFIFVEKSPRYVPQDHLLPSIGDVPKRVGVFVNASEDYILQRVAQYNLSVVQLHGDESPQLAQTLKDQGLTVWKVFGIGNAGFDFALLEPYLPAVDAFLFDTKGAARGGNGVAFDWGILHDYPYQKPFLLSGGVDLDNIASLPKLKHLPLLGIDVNSKFESEPALKDVKKLERLFQKVK